MSSDSRLYLLPIKLRLGFSHLQEHKIQHNFHDTLNALSSLTLTAKLNFFSMLPFLMQFGKSLFMMVPPINESKQASQYTAMEKILLRTRPIIRF